MPVIHDFFGLDRVDGRIKSNAVWFGKIGCL
jgi:hypothetical protein